MRCHKEADTGELDFSAVCIHGAHTVLSVLTITGFIFRRTVLYTGCCCLPALYLLVLSLVFRNGGLAKICLACEFKALLDRTEEIRTAVHTVE